MNSPDDSRPGDAGVIDAINQLEDMINTGRRIPLTPSVVLNEEVALELIDQMRLQLPDDLTQARNVLDERRALIDEAGAAADDLLTRARADAERVLAGARAEAEGVQGAAEEQAKELVADHAVLGRAMEEGNDVRVEAEGDAARVRAEADAYARQVLERLEADLERAVGSVRNGLEALPAATTGRSESATRAASHTAGKRRRPG